VISKWQPGCSCCDSQNEPPPSGPQLCLFISGCFFPEGTPGATIKIEHLDVAAPIIEGNPDEDGVFRFIYRGGRIKITVEWGCPGIGQYQAILEPTDSWECDEPEPEQFIAPVFLGIIEPYWNCCGGCDCPVAIDDVVIFSTPAGDITCNLVSESPPANYKTNIWRGVRTFTTQGRPYCPESFPDPVDTIEWPVFVEVLDCGVWRMSYPAFGAPMNALFNPCELRCYNQDVLDPPRLKEKPLEEFEDAFLESGTFACIPASEENCSDIPFFGATDGRWFLFQDNASLVSCDALVYESQLDLRPRPPFFHGCDGAEVDPHPAAAVFGDQPVFTVNY